MARNPVYMRKYGLDWPFGMNQIQIDLILAKKWMLEPYKYGNLLDPGEHMLRAIRALFTPEQWAITPWTEEHAHAWASENFSVWLGAASSGKAQPLDELIMTPAGPRPMGDLQVGDFVTGLSGAPVRILRTHDAGNRDLYIVTTADGRSTRCAGDHQWVVSADGLPWTCTRTCKLMPGYHYLPHAGGSLDLHRHPGDKIVEVLPCLGDRVPMRCITVDAPDELYMTGSEMITKNSNDAGGLAVLDWITDPLETYIALASTSVPMLKLRSFESVIRYFRILKAHPRFQVPGKEAPSQTAIINDTDSEGPAGDATVKASIRGVALADGDEAKAVARLAGAHLPFVTIILDEGSALPEAAAKARINAMAGTRRFRFLSLANPVDRFDEATKFCVPVDGWDSVDENTPKWRSKFGLVLHHNGFQSPAIKEPEKYPFLINQAQIDAILESVGGNKDDPLVWRMVIGFPAPQGSDAAVLSPADLSAFRMQDPPVWETGDKTLVGGLDPAFTAGGDKCVLQLADTGWLAPRIWGIAFRDPIIIPIEMSSPRPAVYQISDHVRTIARETGLLVSNLAVDDSGTQSVASVISQELGAQPIRCNFASRATEMLSDGRPRFRDLVTQMWYQVARLGREGRLRAFPQEAARQFCSRHFRRGKVPLALETKQEFARRKSGGSPDEADALALCCFSAERLRPRADTRPGSLTSLLAGLRHGKPLDMGYSENSVDVERFMVYANNI